MVRHISDKTVTYLTNFFKSDFFIAGNGTLIKGIDP